MKMVKRALHVLVTCYAIEKVRSNQDPKFLNDDDDGITASPTRISDKLVLGSCCQVPMTINSVLLSFSDKLCSRDHCLM